MEFLSAYSSTGVMRYLSLFSGIEAASVAWLPLGWECVGVAEIEKFPNAVLAHHYPGVPNLGDITKITEAQIKALGHIDLVVGGFPCQDLSVAGKRAGLENEDGSTTRSGLFFTAMRVVEWSGARWTVIENVPGLFSSKQGRDFAAVVGALAGCEFGVPPEGWKNMGAACGPAGLVEWCVLDAQWAGVPQRRRRVFLVRDTGDWTHRPPVLFEQHSLQGHSPPSREKRESTTYPVAPCIGASGRGFERTGDTRGNDAVIATYILENAHATTTTHQAKGGDPTTDNYVAHSLRAEGFDASEDWTGQGTPLVPVGVAGAITRGYEYCYNDEKKENHLVPVGYRVHGENSTAMAGKGTPLVPTFIHLNKGRPDGRQSIHTEMVTLETETIPTLATNGHQQSAIAFISKSHEDETGRGTPLVPMLAPTLNASGAGTSRGSLQANEPDFMIPVVSVFDPNQITSKTNRSVPVPELCHTLPGTANSPIAFTSKDYGADTGETSPTLRAMGHADSHPNAGGQVAIAFDTYNQTVSNTAPACSTGTGTGQHGAIAFNHQDNFAFHASSESTNPLRANQTEAVMTLAIRGRNGNSELETRNDGTANAILTPNGGRAGMGVGAVAYTLHGADKTVSTATETELAGSIRTKPPGSIENSSTTVALQAMQVRRLTPRECERLQQFPDDFTLIPYRGKLAKDGPRYKALGNSFAVPCVRWIGERINMVHWMTS